MTTPTRSFRLFLRTATITVVLLTAAACDEPTAAPTPAAAPPRTEVGVITVQPRKLEIKEELPGRTSAYRVAEVRPQVSGIIVKRLFEEGSEVKAGQPLYQIDPATYKAATALARADLAKAEAGLKAARLKANRYTSLVRTDTVSRQAYDDAIAAVEQGEAGVAAAKAALDAARINLDYTQVASPISGRIGKSAVTEGALVTANQTTALATVTQLDPIYVDVTQSSLQLLKLRKAIAEGRLKDVADGEAPVTLLMEDGHAYPETGRLQFSEVTVEESTGSVRLRAVFANPREDLLPGLFVRAVIRQAEMDGALLVPQRAVQRDAGGGTTVWLVSSEGKVVPQAVTVGQAVGGEWLVEAGLAAGDVVVVEGFQKTRPGALVKAVPLGGSAAQAAAPAATAAR